MLIRPYISQSSLSCFNQCTLKYYLNYFLQVKDIGSKATVLGNILHSAIEGLCLVKKEFQNPSVGSSVKVNHEELGEIECSHYDLYYTEELSYSDIVKINISLLDKFPKSCQLSGKVTRTGRKFVNSLIKRSYEYHVLKNPSFDWSASDLNEALGLMWLLIAQFDPREVEVLSVELPFDLPLDVPGCEIELEGKKLPIRVKGFIDLVYKQGNTICIIDWKSSKSMTDFETGKKKDLDSLSHDTQLMLYFYVCRKLFPGKELCTQILFVRAGGLFSVAISDQFELEIENIVRQHLKDIQNLTLPQPLSNTQSHFKCRFCSYAKSKTFGTSCDCAFINNSLQTIGLEETTKKYKVI